MSVYPSDGKIICLDCGVRTDKGIAKIKHKRWCMYYPKIKIEERKIEIANEHSTDES